MAGIGSKLQAHANRPRAVAGLCFVLSGAASVGYQIVWLRQAMAYFGVITPTFSSFLSIFMFALAVGTFFGGYLSKRLSAHCALRLYIAIECAIVALALVVPFGFEWAYNALLGEISQTSQAYLLLSALTMLLVLMPVCTLMGMTFPVIMRGIEGQTLDHKNFGNLYFANLLGAALGCLLPLFAVEMLGFRATLYGLILLNIAAALFAYVLLRLLQNKIFTSAEVFSVLEPTPTHKLRFKTKLMLFSTGLVALGSEVLWVRLYTPALGTTVYAYSIILCVYLISTFLGTHLHLRKNAKESHYFYILILVPVFVMLPSVMQPSVMNLILLCPVCMALGYIMPRIIDENARNNPTLSAQAYCYNFAGCIVGPLLVTYVLFPHFGIKLTLVLFGLLILICSYLFLRSRQRIIMTSLFVLVAGYAWQYQDIEAKIESRGMLSRDHVGYIGATGKGKHKRLQVNGIGMTYLTTITKNMAHLPLAFSTEPKSALVICLGMGTTLRSLTRWPLESITAVELSRGVIDSFPYFHSDASDVLTDPRVTLIEDDGRRYLSRTDNHYDVITIDPPPPISASGTSLLYSKEFIQIAKKRLKPEGILAHWIPRGDPILITAVINAINQNFRYVRMYKSIEGWGIHILASDEPIAHLTPSELASRFPETVISDIKEWHPGKQVDSLTKKMLMPYALDESFQEKRSDIVMSDDRPYNEFYFLRKLGLNY